MYNAIVSSLIFLIEKVSYESFLNTILSNYLLDTFLFINLKVLQRIQIDDSLYIFHERDSSDIIFK